MQNQEKDQPYTSFIDKKSFLNLMTSASTEFVNSFSKEIRYKNDVLKVTAADGFSYIDCVASENNWSDIVRKIFLQCWSHAELSIGSSGNIAAYFLACEFINNKEDKTLREMNRCISPSTKEVSFTSLSEILEGEVFHFIKDVIEFGGINGSISIKKTDSTLAALELQVGHDFSVGMCYDFIAKSEKRDEAKIILFDGIIQDVSEIDRIFMTCHEKKISCVVVARGFGDDVLSTINKNYMRKTLDIIPIKINDNIESINLINDISACVGDYIINADSGIRLSNIEVEEQPTINNITVTKKRFKFALIDEHKERVASRIKHIKDRINKAHWDSEMSAGDINKVFGPRLNSLSSNSIILWSPGNERQQLFIKNRFLFSLNYIAAFANSGTVNTNDILGSKHNLPQFLPANITDISKALSKKMYSAISNSGGCVAIQ